MATSQKWKKEAPNVTKFIYKLKITQEIITNPDVSFKINPTFVIGGQ